MEHILERCPSYDMLRKTHWPVEAPLQTNLYKSSHIPQVNIVQMVVRPKACENVTIYGRLGLELSA